MTADESAAHRIYRMYYLSESRSFVSSGEEGGDKVRKVEPVNKQCKSCHECMRKTGESTDSPVSTYIPILSSSWR